MRVPLQVTLAALASATLFVAAPGLTPAALPLLVFVPLPGLLVAAEAPMLAGAGWALLAAAVVAALVGGPAVPGFLLPFGLPTITLAIGLRGGWRFESTVLVGVLVWFVGTAALAFLAYGDVATLLAATREQLRHSFDLMLSTYASIGAGDETMAVLRAERTTLTNALIDTLPALVVLSGALVVVLNLALLRRWREGTRTPILRLWRAPEMLIWALIATGFAMFMPLRPLALLARNLFLVVLGCYFCQGLAIVSYYLERFRLPRGVRVAGYVLIALQHVVAGMVLALGVFDLWGNFRRLNAGAADATFHTDGD